ncbi:MAG: XRE family transcriptional regulator, partial [Desulfobacula sp.]
MPPQRENKVKEEVAALNLGNKIRALRKVRALTLQEVSHLTGLSKPLLSQIENNIAAPPIATLIKISTALGVKISHFFQDPEMNDRIVVVRKDERYSVKKLFHHKDESKVGYRWESLAYPMVGKQMEPFIVEIEPRKDEELLYNDHIGEEFHFVMEGKVEFKTAEQTHLL